MSRRGFILQYFIEFSHQWRIYRSTTESLQDFVRRYNAIVRGRIEYHRKFWCRNFNHRLWNAMQPHLLEWIQAKYRLSNQNTQQSCCW
ncbi:hypothetical protein QPC94_004794 [Escherichia coli]|nr:hypothetical protein [Escherichia coli]